jgi:hypothetical protein
MKQETLEEAAEIITTTKFSWQQQKSYSEEEVINIIKEFDNKNNLRGNINKWFEQFKKK